MGNISEIPAETSMKTIMAISDRGIGGAMRDWGATLRRFYGKPDASVSRAQDITLQYLG